MSSSLTNGQPLELKKGQLYLVFDPRLRGMGHNCELAVHPFKRHPLNPVLKSELPWERGGWWMCGTVLWDRENQHFKMWYFGGGPPNWERYICYAQSADGIHWEKPPLGVYDVNGSRDNNICFIGIYTPVIYHEKTATDSNKRYVMWGMQTGEGPDGFKADRGTYRFFSPDGIHWKRDTCTAAIPASREDYWKPTYPDEPEREREEAVQAAGDHSYTYWFEDLQQFVCFRKLNVPGPPARRYVRFESLDGYQWNLDNPTWALAPDETDHRFDSRIEFYGLGIHPVGDLYLATTMRYQPAQGDHIDVGLAHSTDTIKWYRAFRDQPILPRAAAGEWDWGCAAGGVNIVERDDLWWMYYVGGPYVHSEAYPIDFTNRSWGIGLAQTPIGRVVSARCWRTSGQWTVGPVCFAGNQLRLNARIYNELRVVMLDEQEQPIPGFASTMTYADGLQLPVAFERGANLSVLANRAVKLRLEMKNAEVFGFQFE